MMLTFDFACRATKGARDYQEDASAFWHRGNGAEVAAARPPRASFFDAGGDAASPLIAVLADGMGGHVGGSLASRTVCDTFLTSFGAASAVSRDHLIAALDAANGAIAEKVASNPVLSGMGSTLVGVVFEEAGASWVSVGDSPLLLWRRGEIATLNEDHSLAPELDRLAAAGKITHDQARRDPRRHMLRSAVTGDEIDLIDLPRKALKLEPGDYVILASDGLHTLEETEIARIVSAYAGDGPQAVAAALIRAVEAMRDPHQDNATVAVVRVCAAEMAGDSAETAG